MARSTAFEKLRVAHELRRRPIVATAFRSGDIFVCDLSELEAHEVLAAIQIFRDMAYRNPAGDESSRRDSSPLGPEAPQEQASHASRQADAFMDLIATAVRAADAGHAAGDDRYMVHLIRHDHGPVMTTIDGTPIDPLDAATISCDTSTVTHTTTDTGEPLNLGRRSRQWSTAQRRAITVRDHGQCRFPGCTNTHVDIHHIQAWERDGPTDITNGISECRRHHRMLHHGYRTEPLPAGEVRFYRPDGTYIASTHPAPHAIGAPSLTAQSGQGRSDRILIKPNR